MYCNNCGKIKIEKNIGLLRNFELWIKSKRFKTGDEKADRYVKEFRNIGIALQKERIIVSNSFRKMADTLAGYKNKTKAFGTDAPSIIVFVREKTNFDKFLKEVSTLSAIEGIIRQYNDIIKESLKKASSLAKKLAVILDEINSLE